MKYRKIKIPIRKTKHGNKWPRAVEKASSEFSTDPTSPRKFVQETSGIICSPNEFVTFCGSYD